MQDGLRVAGDAAGKRVGQPECRAERQHRHRIGAADRGGERRNGAAHDVPVRIALRHHAPRCLGGDEDRARREPASLLDARPELSDCAELGNGEELILVGGEAEVDKAPCIVELDAALLQGAEIGDGGGERESELLRLGAARGMDHSAVGDGEGAGEALGGSIDDHPRKVPGDVRPWLRALPGHSDRA